MSDQGFAEIYYKGKPLKRDGFTGTMRTIVMQKNNPNRLDMRYKTNRDFVAEQRQWTKQHTPANGKRADGSNTKRSLNASSH